MLERCALRNGNVHSADGWRDVLDPVIARYADRDLGGRFFRADAVYAIPAIYERLEEAGYFVRSEQPVQAEVTVLCAGSVARSADRIAAMMMAKRALRYAMIFRMLWPQPQSTAKRASPIVPLSGDRDRRPSVFM